MTIEPNLSGLLKGLPKTELHIHLQGSILPETAMDLARKNGRKPPREEAGPDFYVTGDLAEFLDLYMDVAATIVKVDDFRRITYEMLEQAARNNVQYTEFFISPHAHKGVPFADQFEGIRQGIRDAETDFGIVSRFSPGVNRQLGPAAGEEYLNEVLAVRGDDMIGLGLDFLEAPCPPEPFEALFARARREGLRLSAHAGEEGPASFVKATIDVLKVDRIDHGYHIIDDPELVARARDIGICFTTCPSTTVYTTIWRDLASPDHAIRRMKEAGLTVTLNTDDPPVFDTDMTRELELGMTKLGFSLDDIKASLLASIDHSWMDDSEKSAMRVDHSAKIDAAISRYQNQQ